MLLHVFCMCLHVLHGVHVFACILYMCCIYSCDYKLLNMTMWLCTVLYGVAWFGMCCCMVFHVVCIWLHGAACCCVDVCMVLHVLCIGLHGFARCLHIVIYVCMCLLCLCDVADLLYVVA